MALRDSLLALSLSVPSDVLDEMRLRLRALRLSKALTQDELGLRSGVSLGSLKRFERTGQISFESLLRLALVLGRLDDFQRFAESLTPASILTLDDSEKLPSTRKRGRRKGH
ncbi:helix-turn-helix domain-containing protein [Asticcacaulis sp. AC402]|uniref:helix-turn-helix domain-containing protein n=1 Tax=Asticcacaulis sp. AC402 TaxID=1282361 RepID=UPI00190F8A84|nr:helix-turn-helix domain-containing protein [Asticcacaulis sp. AC402]